MFSETFRESAVGAIPDAGQHHLEWRPKTLWRLYAKKTQRNFPGHRFYSVFCRINAEKCHSPLSDGKVLCFLSERRGTHMIFPMPNLSEKRIERTSFRNVLWPFSRKSARRPLSVLRLTLLDTKIIERSCVRNYPGCSHKNSAILRFCL